MGTLRYGEERQNWNNLSQVKTLQICNNASWMSKIGITNHVIHFNRATVDDQGTFFVDKKRTLVFFVFL